MLKRTIFITNPAYISTRNEQLIIRLDKHKTEATIPIEDIGFVVMEHPQTTITLPAAQKLNANNVAVVLCDEKRHPNAMLLNLDGHHLQGELFRQQIAASLPLKKQLWQQTVRQKIKNQAGTLTSLNKSAGALPSYAAGVKSGDSSNREGAAAGEYWKRLFGNGFTRDRYGSNPNPFLNYGYAILRAAVARALTGSGLLPTLGIHHHNRYNAFCLADDIMEPYRPFVDIAVHNLWKPHQNSKQTLDKQIKKHLLQLLSTDVEIGNIKRPLMIALSSTTASLARCFDGKAKQITYPAIN